MSFAVKSSVPFFNIFMPHKLSSHQAARAAATAVFIYVHASEQRDKNVANPVHHAHMLQAPFQPVSLRREREAIFL